MGQMFGLWFLASAIGGVMAGLLGGEALDGGLETISPVFSFMIQYYLVIAAVLIGLSFVIKGAEKPSQEE
jgi:dipeptide/tripeptide permease